MIETFSSHHTFSLSLDYTSVGRLPLNIPSCLGYANDDVVTLSETLAVNSIRATCWIESLDEVVLPDISITDSRQQQVIKTMEMQWNSPHKQLDLYLVKNNDNNLVSSIAILNTSGFQYTQYDWMEALDPDNKYFLLGNDTDLAVKLEDAGQGLLTGNDKITILVTVEKKVTILYKTSATVTNSPANQAPTNITLSNSSIDENLAPGATVGVFTASGGYGSNTFTYSLVSGTGSIDNSSFTITGNNLKTGQVFDYETKNNYSIRVRVTDNNNLFFEKSFIISVTDINENQAPTNITLSSNLIDELDAIGSTVGTLNATGGYGSSTFTYSLVSGAGSTDNGSFTIAGNILKTGQVFDYETKNNYSIRVRVTDNNNLFFEKSFIISVTDINENQTQTVYVDLKNNGGITNSPDINGSFMYITGAIASNGNIDFTNGNITLEYPSGYPLDGDFSLTWRINTIGTPFGCIIDLNDGATFAPKILLGDNSNVLVVSHDLSEILMNLVHPNNAFDCELSRIGGNQIKLTVDGEVSVINVGEDKWTTTKITIGSFNDGTYSYNGEMNNFKLYET